MDVTAEREMRRRGVNAAGRLRDAGDIDPAPGSRRIGVDVEALHIGDHQRQAGQKLPLGKPEFAARPLHRDLGLDVEILARVADRVVVVAEHRCGALVHEVHDGRHRPLGIGAIADVVAEQHDPLRALYARARKAGLECLPVGMDIREQSDQHGKPSCPTVASRHDPALIFINREDQPLK
jgi:hypothetical protein